MSARPVDSPGLINAKVVHVTTVLASLFGVALLLITAVSGDATALRLALNPVLIASVGWVMIRRRTPNVAVQLFFGMVGLLLIELLGPPIEGHDPILAFLAMSVAALLFVRGNPALMVVVAAAGTAALSFAYSASATGPVRAQAAIGGAGTVVFMAWLVLWIKNHWLASRMELEDLVRSKDQLVASVSHELRTPMTSVVGLAQELDGRFESFEPQEVRELIGLIVHESTDVANILEDLLVAARADVGTLSLDLVAVDIYDEINSALKTASVATVERHDRTARLYVLADASRVRQILRNLIVNASRHGGPEMRVKVGQVGDAVAVSVCDDGEPIPDEQRARMFEPYEGVPGSKYVPGSVGLGLTVSRQLARLMGGDLEYGHNGHETMFTLTLPTAPAPAPEVAAEAHTRSAQ